MVELALNSSRSVSYICSFDNCNSNVNDSNSSISSHCSQQ